MLRLLLISLLLLAGCATETTTVMRGECYNKALPMLLDSTDLKGLFQGIAAELCTGGDPSRPCTPCGTADCPCAESAGPAVLVTDFVDLQTYLPNASGLLLGELMRAGLNGVCKNEVVEAEFGKYFTLSERGLVVLTRDPGGIMNNDYANREAIVGTYSYVNSNKVLIFVRRINTATGKVAKMASRELDYACAGRSVVYKVH